jgi:hypothetical protein
MVPSPLNRESKKSALPSEIAEADAGLVDGATAGRPSVPLAAASEEAANNELSREPTARRVARQRLRRPPAESAQNCDDHINFKKN